MSINKQNYEAYFLDYIEGCLDDSATLEMMAFIRNNPELKQELELFGITKLLPAYEIFHQKETLKKMDFKRSEIDSISFVDYCIAYHENLLDKDETEKLHLFLKDNPEKLKDFQLFGNAYLKSDNTIIFKKKALLKKRIPIILFNRTIALRWSAVAAGVILIISIYNRYNTIQEQTNSIVDVTTPKVIQPEIPSEKSYSHLIDNNSENKLKKDLKTVSKVLVTNNKPAEDFPKAEPGSLIMPIGCASVGNNYANTIKPILRPSLEKNTLYIDTESYGFVSNVKSLVKSNVLKTRKKIGLDRQITLWDIADITIKGYNQISENEFALVRTTDENGKITSLAIETNDNIYGYSFKK